MGDKIYYTYMDKSIALFNIGTDDIELGMNILGAHIDSPRIDVKQNPQYEDSNLLFWDTHYYGGIKKISLGSHATCHSWCCGKNRWNTHQY